MNGAPSLRTPGLRGSTRPECLARLAAAEAHRRSPTGRRHSPTARPRWRVAAWDAMMEAATEDRAQPSGVLRIAGPRIFGETAIAPLLAEFLQAQPRLRADLVLDERQVDLVGEGFDLAIRVSRLPDSGMVAIPLGDFSFVHCASREYLARRGTPLVPEDLSGHDCILTPPVAPNGQWLFGAEGNTRRIAIEPRVRVNGDRAAAACVRGGLGIGPLFRAPVAQEIAAGTLVPVLERWAAYDRRAFAILPHRRGMPAKTRPFVDFLKDRLG